MRRRPASASACAFCGSSEPLVVSVRSTSSCGELRDQALEVAAHERLAAGDPELLDAERDEDARDARDLLEGEELAPLEEPVVAAEDLLRHAVDAAEVAAVGDRDPEVAQRPAEGVKRVHAGNRSSTNWRKVGRTSRRQEGKQTGQPGSHRRVPRAHVLNRGDAPRSTTFCRDYDVHELHSIAYGRVASIGRRLATPRRCRPGRPPALPAARRAGTKARSPTSSAPALRGARADRETRSSSAAGTPWRPGGGIRPFAEAAPGTVRVAANFLIDGARLYDRDADRSVDDAARRAFLRYWRIVGPFSAVIRRRWLKQIAR